MQKILNSSHASTVRTLITSFFVAAFSYVIVWATYGRDALLYVPVSSDTSSLAMLLAFILPYLMCLGAIGAVAYILLRRKIAIAAAVVTALLISSLSHLIMLAQGSEMILVISLLAIISTVIFYGIYRLLATVRKPKLIGAILFASAVVLLFVVSAIVLYILRVNYAS